MQSAEPPKRQQEWLADPYRPIFHFTSPWGWLNDPNGTVYWRGRWHMFYQCVPGVFEGGGHALWAHAVSEDLVHWIDLPHALTPEPGTYDENGCWSGTAMVEDERVVASYHAHLGGTCIATASDELLTDWVKHSANPVVPFDPEKTYDPCIWREGDTYCVITGRITGASRGDGQDQEGGGRDIAYIYTSEDLAHWEYSGVFYEGGVFTNPGEDCACPDFFPIGDKHMLLFLSHNQGMQYYIGDYFERRFTPTAHGRMNYTMPGIGRLATCGDITAPISWSGPDARRIVTAWVPEGLTWDAMRSAKWAGVMSMPRDISLGPDGRLRIEPVPEMRTLRRNHRSLSGIAIGAEPVDVEQAYGDALEMRILIEPRDADLVGLRLRRSPNGEEETVITVDVAAQTITLDPTKASLSPDVVGADIQQGPLELAAGEEVELRVFVDRSIVEVFANGRQCLTKRIYPTRTDSLGVQLFAGGGEAGVCCMDVWEMASAWPVE